MNLELGPEIDALRERVRSFCREHWPPRGELAAASPREQAIAFRQRGIEEGLLFRTVPRAYGGSGVPTDVFAETAIRQELDRAGVPHRTSPQGVNMLVPTLLEVGTEEQRQRYVRPTLTGELIWCQGYSEPGAGSDLASLQSRAVLEDDEWVIHGHKIWTSQATEADMMFGLFRTEPEQPRHAGISYLIVPMDREGIDVRPLPMMTGGADFCEVFFDGVRIPAENIVGRRGEGWKVSRATLKHERMLIGDASALRRAFEEVVKLAREAGRARDTAVRQRLAEIEGFVATQEFASARMLTAIGRNRDAEVASEMLMAKLYSTNTIQKISRLAMDLLADRGLHAPVGDEKVMGIRAFTPGYWVAQSMTSLGQAIAGGASNIQRNIIGERLLGLPRDPRPGDVG